MQNVHNLNQAFDSPKPLDTLLSELMQYLGINQETFANAAEVSQSTLSRIMTRQTIYPSKATLKKLHSALVEKFDLPADVFTLDYLIKCRDVTAPHKAADLDARFVDLGVWLQDQPDDVQTEFWQTINVLRRTIDAARSTSSSD